MAEKVDFTFNSLYEASVRWSDGGGEDSGDEASCQYVVRLQGERTSRSSLCEVEASVVGEEGGVHGGQFGWQKGMDAEDERLQVCTLQFLVERQKVNHLKLAIIYFPICFRLFQVENISPL